ncbi:hypothetical protein UPYG_G00049080 [Umbra pygmaea]|uniref:C-type lectin domain-containing protein n=1 Tax=Umbra pygmaea TaxID=75934 RepID=A0ABD0Y6V5_UMBPY
MRVEVTAKKENMYDSRDGVQDFKLNKLKSMDIDDHTYVHERPIQAHTKYGFGAQHLVWKRRFIAALSLGILCVLLCGVIVVLVYEQYKLNSANNLTKEGEQLQTSYRNMTKEKDQLQTSNNTLTKQKDQLQTSYNNLTKERNQLQISYNTLTKERDQLQTSCRTRDQLQTSYNTVTKERDQLKQSLSLKVCPDGWIKFGSSCYYISTEKKTWDESREDCLQRGGDLVIINSLEEQTFLNFMKVEAWIGLTDTLTKGKWIWVDHTALSTPTYWGPQEPNGAVGMNCAITRFSSSGPGSWWDWLCSGKSFRICEK